MKITKKTLYTKIPLETFTNPHANLLLAKQMLDFMYKNRGIGLASNQVGYQKRLFVMHVNSPKICFNPEVIRKSLITETGDEGCLSFKGEYVYIDRPADITVKYQTYDGKEIREELAGLEARCFMHELDHLEGITMYKRKQINELA